MNILIDTREKKPYDFEKVIGSNDDLHIRKLDTGDYSLEGLDQVLSIENKASVAEIAKNIVEDRFWDEMERLCKFKYKFIVCQFGVPDIMSFPYGENSGIPIRMRKRVRVRPKFIISKLNTLQIEYGIPTIFAGDRTSAEAYIYSLLKKVDSACKVD